MEQALYRKNRPRSLKQVVGQDHITHTLENAIKKGAISHAYLFTGPRGVGKTSVARILAHEINGLAYDDDSVQLDIIEIDAASNRRIDEIRDLRDKVNIAPTSAKYKVYIIDEVHMLTREAFNALLKTLEEPPAHVVFILATTEAHKLPDTIVSRTQRFTFKPVSKEVVVDHLRNIAKQEKISISDGALALMAEHGEGSFRDSISLLDQSVGHEGQVDEAYVTTMLGIPSAEAIEELVEALNNHDTVSVVQILSRIGEQGFTAPNVAKQLGISWRSKLLGGKRPESDEFELLQKLLDVPAAYDPEKYLELVLLKYTLSGTQTIKPAESIETVPAEVKKKGESAPEVTPSKPEAEKQKNAPQKQKVVAAVVKPETATLLDISIWPQILAELKKHHNTLYGVVRTANPTFSDGSLELGFAFAFHRKRLSEAKNQAIITGIIKDLTGQKVSIECVEYEGHPADFPEAAELTESVSETKPAKSDIESISNIFGGGELLES